MLLNLINNALQKYLDSDPEIAQKLGQYEGKDLLVNLSDIKKAFIVSPDDARITVTEHIDAEIEKEFTTTITSNIVTLIRVGLGADTQPLLSKGSLKIEGDIELANQLQAIFKEIDIDWEEVAAKYIGDSAAYQLGLFVSKFKNYSSRSTKNFRLDVSEYLQEESRILPTKIEIDRFMNDVDVLDADVQRMEARVQRLIELSES